MASFRSLTNRAGAVAALVALTACTTAPRVEEPLATVSGAVSTPAVGSVLAQNDRFVAVRDGSERHASGLARRFLGTEERAWEIAKFNGITRAEPGRVVAIPLQPINPGGVTTSGFQTVPILCYHRFGPKASKMIVTPDAFAAQLDYLARNGYRVVRLAQLSDFLAGKRGLPDRARGHHDRRWPRLDVRVRLSAAQEVRVSGDLLPVLGFHRLGRRAALDADQGDGRLRSDRLPGALEDPREPGGASAGRKRAAVSRAARQRDPASRKRSCSAASRRG